MEIAGFATFHLEIHTGVLPLKFKPAAGSTEIQARMWSSTLAVQTLKFEVRNLDNPCLIHGGASSARHSSLKAILRSYALQSECEIRTEHFLLRINLAAQRQQIKRVNCAKRKMEVFCQRKE